MAHLPTAYESIPVPYDAIIYIYIYTVRFNMGGC